jgi:hypothetical protein
VLKSYSTKGSEASLLVKTLLPSCLPLANCNSFKNPISLLGSKSTIQGCSLSYSPIGKVCSESCPRAIKSIIS